METVLPRRLSLVALAALLHGAVAAADASKPTVPTVLRAPRPTGTEWFGLYVLGKKAGWATSEMRADTFEGRPAVFARSEVTLSAKVGGVATERSLREDRYYEARDGGALLAFRIEKKGDGGDEVLAGRCSSKEIRLTRVRPGLPDETRVLPPTAEVVEAADAVRMVALTKKVFEGKTLDPEELKDQGTRTRLVGDATYVVAGVAVPVTRVETVDDKDKVPATATLDREGRVLEIKFGEVMVAKAEPEATAKKLDEVDLFSLTRVVLPKPIGPGARKVPGAITYRVRGMVEGVIVKSPRQTWAPQPDGSMLLTVKAGPPSTKARRPRTSAEGEISEALAPTLSIESTDPKIKELASKLVGDVPDAVAASRRLVLFVSKYVERSYGTSSDRCTDVLAAKKGDCTEHALLFTCLARAAGIPARRVDGLVYMDSGDGVPAFYWHEWAEVYVGEWVAVDPTFEQPLADATHIALGGEGSAQSAGLIGQLKIEVVESGTR